MPYKWQCLLIYIFNPPHPPSRLTVKEKMGQSYPFGKSKAVDLLGVPSHISPFLLDLFQILTLICFSKAISKFPIKDSSYSGYNLGWVGSTLHPI